MDNFDPTISSLLPAVGLLRQDWVHKFFFETSNTDRLSQLSYALNSPITMTGTLKMSADELATSPPNSDLTFLFAPSFTTGSLTVGFDIIDRTAPMHHTTATARRTSVAARDDEAGIFISVAEHAGLTEVAFCSKVTPGCRAMIFLLIKSDAFRYVTDKNFDENVVRNNLVTTLYSLDVRDCPSCETDSVLSCTCSLPVIKKSHPGDLDSEVRNIDSYVGSFKGFSNFRVYENGRPVSVSNCVSAIHTSVTKDMEWKQALSIWAMREASENSPMNLVKLCMPDADQQNLQTMPSGNAGNSSHNDIVRLISSLHEAGNDKTSGISVNNVVTSAYSSSEAEQIRDITCSQKLTSSNEVGEIRSCDGALKEAEGIAQQDRRKGSEIRDSLQSEPNTSTEYQIEPSHSTSRPSTSVHPTGTGEERARVIEQVTAKRVVPIAPGTGFVAARVSGFEEELRRKDEKRKARNRASALRSNEKKRVYLKQLKEDLVAAGKMETTLRDKEKSLREENLKLKASIRR